MNRSKHALIHRIGRLRTELIDLAYRLDTRGRHDAADVAMSVSARLAEFCEDAGAPAIAAPAAVSGIARAVR